MSDGGDKLALKSQEPDLKWAVICPGRERETLCRDDIESSST